MVKPGGRKKRSKKPVVTLSTTPQAVDEGRVEHMRVKKNKIAKSEMYHKLRGEKLNAKRARRLQRKADIKEYGEENCPIMVQKSIDSAREHDATIDVVDEEDMNDDEFQSYFAKEREPKVMLTTCFRPCKRTKEYVKELKWLFPHSKYYARRDFPLRDICTYATNANFTDVVSIQQSHGAVCGLIISHLPNGPTAKFRVSNLKIQSEIDGAGERTGHVPELFLKNFDTAVGKRVGRMVQSLFPTQRDFAGRAVVTFLNKRDFIFVRAHRYIFKGMDDVAIQELGPRFTLRLKSIYRGTFADCDPKTGSGMSVEWTRKREKSRR
eukprot:PhF_6_TR22765/c0_g1_i1/m.32460/K14846/RPF1; ribosome production factor 1